MILKKFIAIYSRTEFLGKQSNLKLKKQSVSYQNQQKAGLRNWVLLVGMKKTQSMTSENGHLIMPRWARVLHWQRRS